MNHPDLIAIFYGKCNWSENGKGFVHFDVFVNIFQNSWVRMDYILHVYHCFCCLFCSFFLFLFLFFIYFFLLFFFFLVWGGDIP